MSAYISYGTSILVRKSCRPNHIHRSLFTCTALWSKSRTTSLNYYQVLGIEKDASSKDIRAAFLELSKTCHPDIGSESTADNHDKFVQINEAYSILSKPLSRRDYDQSLLIRRSVNVSQQYSQAGPGQSSAHTDDGNDNYYSQFYANRNTSEDHFYQNKPYYGVKGISKVSNRIIVYTCMGIVLVGAIFHFFVVKRLSDITIEHLNERDRKTHQVWVNANDPSYISDQIEIMKKKIEEMEANKKKD